MPRIRKGINPAQDPKYQHALQERDRAVEIVRAALHITPNVIRTWVQHFDHKFERQIDCQKFCAGLRALRFEGDPELLFLRLDVDKIDEVTLDIIDPDAAKLWMGFRMWCVKTFTDEKTMINELSRGYGSASRDAFLTNLRRLGWGGENEELLFEALNLHDKQELRPYDLTFFAVDKRKFMKARKGMPEAVKLKTHAAQKRTLMTKARKDFKAFLKKKFGTLLRAWRTLDADDSMFMQKNELFRAVKDLCWQGDARILWQGLDKDGSGITTLQELDLKSAEQLAKFKQQVGEKFGDAQAFFQAIDTSRINKVRQQDFIEKCDRFGITRADKRLFHGLDWEGKKFLTAKDLSFVDLWKCPRYLTCSANAQAARDFKSALLQIYPTVLKAWRQLLDRDGSNVVGWEEFEAAAKRLNFQRDLPGAWRFFDQDISGSISFGELDVASYAELSNFKSWADEEFGGVRAAFAVLDEDNSGDFNVREFIKMLRFYGFQGDCRALFSTLDCDGQGSVSLNEVAFLDLWESAPPSTPLRKEREKRQSSMRQSMRMSKAQVAQPVKKMKPPRISPRLEQLARSRHRPLHRLPLLSNVASKSTLNSFTTVDSKISKASEAKLLKSVYGRFSRTDGFFGDLGDHGDLGGFSKTAWRNFRVKVMKEEILSSQINKDCSEPDAVNMMNADFFKVKKKTVALRLRTMELLSKDADGTGDPGSPTRKIMFQSSSADSL